MDAVRFEGTYRAWTWRSFHADGLACRAPWACPRVHRVTLVGYDEGRNLVTLEGRNEALSRLFIAVPANVNWFVGLKSVGAVSSSDVMATHAAWAEKTGYSNATRPAYTAGAVSGGALDNSAAKAAFNINANDTIYGAFLTSDSTKGGTAGKLYSVGDYATARIVAPGDTHQVQYNLGTVAT